MHVVNCHQNTEAADLLGGLRPLRGREMLVQELRERGGQFLRRCVEATSRMASMASDGNVEVSATVATASNLERVDVAGVTNLVQV